jgi:hypothetical protein
MVARQVVAVLALALIGFLFVMTVRVMVNQGVDFVVVLSLIVLVILGVGVVGALWSASDD